MANNKELNPASVQANNLIAELPEKRKTSIQFRNELLESQKRLIYQNEFDRLHNVKRMIGLQ